ncbi:MAG: dockerin type I domain-containing protein [Ruminococcus sp.]|nr:dockerin type I domain-containing protein [Ruminococcus sp.]
MKLKRKIGAVLMASALCFSAVQMPEFAKITAPVTASAASVTISDMPADYRTAADWIWENRVQKEGSVARWNTLFDQIVANNGELNYVVRWQSYKQLTLEQRKKFAEMVDTGINEWCQWLKGYENWPYEHIKVNIVGWAVLDKNCLLDLQPDEVVWDNLISDYDSSGDTSNGYEQIPSLLPSAPEELWTFNYFTDRNHVYNGQSFDEYLWCTEGFPNVGGCGGDWGQRLSDNAYLSIVDGTGFPHVYWHELGHGFGMTDFYGGEGESDGFPPGGFPGGENSLMMAGSASKITDFDGWFLRYLWTKIKDDENRFDLSQAIPPVENTAYAGFTDTISDIGSNYVTFSENGTYYFNGDYYDSDEQKNLSHYEAGDKITVNFSFYSDSRTIVHIDTLTLEDNVRDDIIRGDVNADRQFNVADLVMMQNYLIRKGTLTDWNAGDLSEDKTVDIYDMILMRQLLMSGTSTDEPADTSSFISSSIAKHGASLPTQGDAKLVVFYVDFPDCRYSEEIDVNALNNITFGAADENNSCYPFESISAFYSRASKGSMNFDGQVFRYTTKENQSSYDTDKVKIAEECYEAFKDQVDFSQFDGNGDGKIDATLFTVPTAAGDDNWWPCAGAFGDSDYRVDGKAVGHIITGNAQVNSLTDYTNYTSSYAHELGHCTGMPDFYLYSGGDAEGMHGTAGFELMDTDAASDFSCFSKLMTGWFRQNQVQVFDSSKGTQTFKLTNSVTDSGNCLIIPYGSLADDYFSEYFILEYAGAGGNNKFHCNNGGVRVYHIDATTQYDWNTYFRYASGSQFTNNDSGRRLIRIIDDTNTDNFYRTGSVIDSSISGFHWYDSNDQQTVKPGIKITVDSFENDTYTVTVSQK